MNLIDTFFNAKVFWDTLPLLLEGLWTTILLGVVSIIAGLLTGLAMALARLYGPPFVRTLARTYIDKVRRQLNQPSQLSHERPAGHTPSATAARDYTAAAR